MNRQGRLGIVAVLAIAVLGGSAAADPDGSAAPAPALSSPSPSPSWSAEHNSVLRTTGIVGMVAGGAAIAVGIGFGGIAEHDAGAAHTTWGDRATGLIAAGAAVVVGSAIVYSFGRRGAHELAVAPDVGGSHVGAALVGRF